MAEIAKIKTIDGTEYDLKDAIARSNYVAKNGDTMTGGLRAPYFYSTDNGSTGYNGLSFTSGGNVVKARIHYAQSGTTSSHLVFGQDSADGTKYAEFSLPEITENADYTILTTANAIISGFKTTQAGGYQIDQWGNFVHTSDTASNSFCIDSHAGAHNFKYTFETGELQVAGKLRTNEGIECDSRSGSGHGGYIDFHFNGDTNDYTSRIIETASGTLSMYASLAVSSNLNVSGYIVGATGVYATNGSLVSRAATAFVKFENASAQPIGEIWSQTGRIFIRNRPSAGSSYYTDIVLPTAKTNSTENVYVYTSRNFSLSGTTLTITVPT